jgi:hypothetical protein
LSEPIQYASFLIRIWREGRVGDVPQGAVWQAEVEHIQSSRRWTYKTVPGLLAFLRQQAENIPAGLPQQAEEPGPDRSGPLTAQRRSSHRSPAHPPAQRRKVEP